MLQCGECGYVLSESDKECPRCLRKRQKQAATQKPRDDSHASPARRAGPPEGAAPQPATARPYVAPWGAAALAYRAALLVGIVFAIVESFAGLLVATRQGTHDQWYGLLLISVIFPMTLEYFSLSVGMGWLTAVVLRRDPRPASYRAGLLAGAFAGGVCFGVAAMYLSLLRPAVLGPLVLLLPLGGALWGAIRGLISVAVVRRSLSRMRGA